MGAVDEHQLLNDRVRDAFKADRRVRNGRDAYCTGHEFERRRRQYVGLKTATGSPVMSREESGAFRVDLTGGCPMAFERTIRTRQQRVRGGRAIGNPGAVMHIAHRCNKRDCEVCADRLRRKWTARSLCEARLAERTWLCSLTLRPEEHVLLDMRAAKKAGTMSGSRFQKARASELGRMVYRWIGRITGWNVAANLRYFAVIEPHKSLLVHAHVLLHEKHVGAVIPAFLLKPVALRYQGAPVALDPRTESCEWIEEKDRNGETHLRYRVIDQAPVRQAWEYGFSRITLMLDERACGYAAKYLGKGSLGRTKTSRRYGQSVGS